MVDSLSLFFGKKRRARRSPKRRSPGRRPGRGRSVRKLTKSQAYISVGGRRRKLHRGRNGGLFYRTRSGRHYVPASVLRRKGHVLSPKRRRRKSSKKRKSPKKRRGGRKLKMTKKAIAARKAYRKKYGKKKSKFGRFMSLNQAMGPYNDAAAKQLDALLKAQANNPILTAANNVYSDPNMTGLDTLFN